MRGHGTPVGAAVVGARLGTAAHAPTAGRMHGLDRTRAGAHAHANTGGASGSHAHILRQLQHIPVHAHA